MTPAGISQILGSKGQIVTILGTASATYDPSTGTATPTAYSATATAVPLPLNAYKWQGNSLVVSGDETLLLAAVGTNAATIGQPPLGSEVTLADGTSKYTLIAVDPLHPSGDELIYDCVIRRAA